jgi:hypothetical protein
MKIIKIYNLTYFGKLTRKSQEKKLFAKGFKIESEEEIKEWDGGTACCLAILFLPLIFFGKVKKIKVIYNKE